MRIRKNQFWLLLLALLAISAIYLFLAKVPENTKHDTANSISKLREEQTVQELSCLENANDRELYREAMAYIDKKQYGPAYEILNKLEPKYSGTAIEHVIMLRSSDCIFMSDYDSKNTPLGDSDTIFKVLEDILDSNRYSPVLYEAFRKWRTQTQVTHYGMSNMSKIPNDDYNLKRQQVINTIRHYLEINPDNQWAKTQLKMLINLPDIGRGGPFGNDVLTELGVLYPM